MGTKRIECVADCWRFDLPVCIWCKRCGHYAVAGSIVYWVNVYKGIPSSWRFEVIERSRRFVCSKCGGKDVGVRPGNKPGVWKGNR